MNNPNTLPDLDQTLDELEKVEKSYDEGQRIAQTKRALDINEKIAGNRQVIESYYKALAEEELFVEIYGHGEYPWALPVHLPPYLIEILLASARVMLAQVRQQLHSKGPDYLLRRMPDGWLTDEMAEILHRYFQTFEPDLAFDVLVYGANSERGMTFNEFKASGDHLYAKMLEAQSVDTYYGWMRKCIQLARQSGAFDDAVFTMLTSDDRPFTDSELDAHVLETYMDGLADKQGGLLFLEIDPENQPSFKNLALTKSFLSAENMEREILILDPQDLHFQNGQLYYRHEGQTGPLDKVISRIVYADLEKYIKKMEAAQKSDVIKQLQKIYATPSLWPDLSKHLAGFYLIDKSSLTDLALLNRVGVAPKTWTISDSHIAAYRKEPDLLNQMAIKPLHGMSSKGVMVTPGLADLEKSYAQETTLGQELLWATPVMPNINRELTDPDAMAGICSETRLQLHAGTLVAPSSPHQARCIMAISRSHYTSKDPGRKIKDDNEGRGWFSNMGAILAVKKELGIIGKRDAGLGMSPICWTI
ncbi:hypothetical protein QUF90_00820 [Desulfococcaceae bacterium HSG9]|nr:hypothetical protein [Desulfococcaceae bacterium HSG9]